jgi:hypothetical protein
MASSKEVRRAACLILELLGDPEGWDRTFGEPMDSETNRLVQHLIRLESATGKPGPWLSQDLAALFTDPSVCGEACWRAAYLVQEALRLTSAPITADSVLCNGGLRLQLAEVSREEVAA